MARKPKGRPDATVEKPAKNHPLTSDEKVDEASEESMDASDPPGYYPVKAGAPNDKSSKPDTPKRR